MEVQQQFGDNVTIVGVPGSNDLSSVNDFVEGTGSGDVVHLSDPDGALWDTFEVQRRHTYILVTRGGAVERVDFSDLSTRLSTLT